MTTMAERVETGSPKMERPEVFHKAMQISERRTVPTPEELAIINRYTKRTHSAEEIYVSACDLCNDQRDRSFEWFPEDVLADFAASLPAKSLLGGHDHSGLPMGLWFDAAVQSGTVNGKPARVLHAKSYIVKTRENEHHRAQLEGGVYRYASVGFRALDLLCDICGQSWFGFDCQHYAGETYEVDGKRVIATAHYTRSDEHPAEAVEGSIVYLGCQFDAELKAVEGQKSFGGITRPRERAAAHADDAGGAEEAVGAKPYPGEHACRLEDPDNYSTCRRQNDAREHEGKKYDVITCKRKDDPDKWDEQAYRYNSGEWTADQARSHCETHDGTFEAASGGEDAAPAADMAARLDAIMRAYPGWTMEQLRELAAGQIDWLEKWMSQMDSEVRAKIGRVLSAANETKLRQARELIDQGAAMIAEVLQAVEQTQGDALNVATLKLAIDTSQPMEALAALQKAVEDTLSTVKESPAETVEPDATDSGAPSAENTPDALNARLARESLEQSLQRAGVPIRPEELLGSSGDAATAAEDSNERGAEDRNDDRG